jgi:synaptosomal-associated protein 29
MYESEKVGIATAEELSRQGEKLNNIGTNVDSMNAIMRTTQKNLTSMKSFFGGMKNLFGKPDQEPNGLPNSRSTPGLSLQPEYKSNLGNTVAQISKEASSKPANNYSGKSNGGLDTTGFKLDDDEIGASKNRRSSEMSHKQQSALFDKQIDDNLGELGLGLGRLKNLALGLGDEIEAQNELIEGITSRSERADDTLRHQNRQMAQLLKK